MEVGEWYPYRPSIERRLPSQFNNNAPATIANEKTNNNKQQHNNDTENMSADHCRPCEPLVDTGEFSAI
jgi:hypothetical protein